MRRVGGNASADPINDVACEFPTLFKGFEVAPPQHPLATAFKGVFFIDFVGFRPAFAYTYPHHWVHPQPCRFHGGTVQWDLHRTATAQRSCPLGDSPDHPPSLPLFSGRVGNGFRFSPPLGRRWRPRLFRGSGRLCELMPL